MSIDRFRISQEYQTFLKVVCPINKSIAEVNLMK
jgi:hypothetical protein